MEISPTHQDQVYRFPALEDGIDFALSSSQCQYLEVVHFKAANGKSDINCSEGKLNGEEVVEWIRKVCDS